MKGATVLIILLMVTTTTPWLLTLRRLIAEEWLEYKLRYNKSYSSAKDDLFHKALFLKRRLSMARHNQRYERGKESYRQAINQFSDLPLKPHV